MAHISRFTEAQAACAPEGSCELHWVGPCKLHAGPALHGLDPGSNTLPSVLLHPVALQLLQSHEEALHEGPPDQVTLCCTCPGVIPRGRVVCCAVLVHLQMQCLPADTQSLVECQQSTTCR